MGCNLLKDLLEKDRIYDEDIPASFKTSFFNYMLGNTVGIEYNNPTKPKIYYYPSDYSRWYSLNEDKIERHYKLKNIIDKI